MTSQAIPLGPPVRLELRHCALEHSDMFPSLSGSPRRLRPAAGADIGHLPILDAIAELLPGEAVRISVDHDPEPLLQIVETNNPAVYAWEPLVEGPTRWVGLIRRRQSAETQSARRLSPQLARRASAVGARARLDREIRELAIDLVGPADPGELSPESAAWLSAATDAAVGAVRDGTLSVLVRALDTLLEAAPPEVGRELAMVRDRRDTGLT
jgi:uncharacterized protein (DUF2249 family)